MKKIILTLAILISGGYLMSTNAQTSASFGVKLSGNLTNVKLSDSQNKNSFKPGVSLGGFSKIEFNENFALQPELSFSYTENKIRLADEKTKFKYASVEIPVYAVGQIQLESGKLFLGLGPHIGYGFSIDSKTEAIPEGAPGNNKIELDHWYMGGSAMVGYEFNNKISIHARYQMGWDLSSKNKNNDIRTQTISLGVGYRF